MSAALQHLQRKKKKTGLLATVANNGPSNTVLSAHCWSSSWPSRS